MQRDLRQLETEAAYERSELERCGSLPGYRYRCADEPGDVVAGQGPGGHFLYTDLRPRHLVADWESAIAEAPMALRSERVVNAEVLRGIEKNTHHWSLILLDRHLPAFLRRFGREFAVAQGSQVYRDLQREELSFRMYWFAKD
jgi:hypothetical protein